jgi:phosphomannomutase
MAANLSLGVSGMHGLIGSGITPQNAIRYASAIGTYLDGGPVVVGIDTRTSSAMLRHAAFAALMGCGCEIHDSGVCPSPVLQHLVRELGAAGGLLIGAGHHPAEWNALIPISASGAYASPLEAQSLLELYHSQDYRLGTWRDAGSVRPVPAAMKRAYVDTVFARVDAGAIREARLTVVADYCNGSGGDLGRELLGRLGVRCVAINDRGDSFLPHDPEPRPRASVQARALMAPLDADAGFVFNSDMTRMAIVSDSGETLSEEYTLPLLADHVLGSLREPCTVVTNVCTTRTLDDVVRRHGSELDKTAVGQAQVVDRMLELRSPLAGEGCGSVAYGGGTYGYDGFLMMALFLEALASSEVSATDLARRLRRFHLVKRKILCPVSHAYSLIHRLPDRFPDAAQSEFDGLRFDWDAGWVHVRHSKTEPAIRLIVEWETPRGAIEMADRFRALIEREITT